MTEKDTQELTSLASNEVVDISVFDLHMFFPYQVRVFYKTISDSISNIYGPQYALSAAEWRTMAVLRPNNTMSASDIVERSSMTKVAVSRAIKSLQAKSLIKRDIDGDDKRRVALRFTHLGDDIFAKLIPLVLQLEVDLLEGIPPKDIEKLLEVMDKISRNAEKTMQAD